MKNFNYKKNLKRLSEKFSKDSTCWDYSKRVEITGFFNEGNLSNSGRNRMNTLCTLKTKTIDFEDINFIRNFGSDSDFITMYMNVDVCSDSNSHLFIELDYKKYNELHINLDTSRDTEKIKEMINGIFSRHISKNWRNSKPSNLDKLVNSFKYQFNAAEIIDYKFYLENGLKISDFTKFIMSNIKIKKSFRYNYKMNVSDISKIKESKNILKFVYTSCNTYESRKFEVKISKKIKRDSAFIELRKIGGETRGYYNHSENLKILPSQLNDALKFINRTK